MIKDLENLISLLNGKYLIDQKEGHAKEIGFYLNALEEEIVEVKTELKENNSVYLEDELGDIFRCYLNFLKKLEKNGYIDSLEKVFIHSNEKFSKRLDGREKGILWDITKKQQKEELKERHNLKHNK